MVAMPFRFRQRPRPYCLINRGSSRIREAVAMVCDSRSAPMISKPGRGRSGYLERDGAGVGDEPKCDEV
jgi:hypothetical protein